MKTPTSKGAMYVGVGVLIGLGIFLLIWLLFLKKREDKDAEKREQNYSDADAMMESTDPAVRQLGRDLINAQVDADKFTGAEIGTTAAAAVLVGGAMGLLTLAVGAGVAVGAIVAGVVTLAVAAAMYGIHGWIDDKMLKSLETQRDELRKGTWPGVEQPVLVPDGEGGYKTETPDQETITPGDDKHPEVPGQKISGEDGLALTSGDIEDLILTVPGLSSILKEKS